MANTNVNVAGVVKFFLQEKGFGIIVTKDAEVFIHVTKCGGKQTELVEGAEVRIDYLTTYKEGQYKHAVTSLISVKPVEETVILSTIAFYSLEKGFGGVHCGDTFSRSVAHLPGKVCRDAGIEPGRGMPVRVAVIEGPQGPLVTSLEWGVQVEADYAAANPVVTEVGRLKYFDAKKSFGILIREDGSTIGFALSNVAKDLRDDFKKKYRKGTKFAFVVGDFRGKPTALITELVELAPEQEVVAVEGAEAAESVEGVAVEVIAPVEEVVAAPEVAAVVESEAKPAKAPRKKAAPKPKGKVTGKSGGIPSAKGYGVHPDDLPVDVKTIAQTCILNGSGGSMAEAFASAK